MGLFIQLLEEPDPTYNWTLYQKSFSLVLGQVAASNALPQGGRSEAKPHNALKKGIHHTTMH